jgi:threonine/homoserine/homoserine lactone efflux protein
MDAVFAGILAGLLLAVLIGPVFFALIQVSINHGFIFGLIFAIGIIISDICYFLIAYFGISSLVTDGNLNRGLGLVGGLFLIGFGLRLLLRKPKTFIKSYYSKTNVVKSFSQAFMLNTLNPFVLIYWIGIISTLGTTFSFTQLNVMGFLSACFGTIFFTDVLKAYLASKLQKLLSIRFIFRLNRISGVLLLLFGLRMIWYVITLI